jgi:uncharacterized protein
METCCKKSPRSELTWHAWFLVGPIRIYRYMISPLLGPHCRFEPSCSNYAELAISQHGLLKGTLLTLKRLAKCHPWHVGGYDPVPAKSSSELQ